MTSVCKYVCVCIYIYMLEPLQTTAVIIQPQTLNPYFLNSKVMVQASYYGDRAEVLWI